MKDETLLESSINLYKKVRKIIFLENSIEYQIKEEQLLL